MLPVFLNSPLLWFLPLAAVPIVLHLLTLHRLRTVELSTFRFLFDSYVQQRRRMRFLEALLALLRTLFLLFLVFVICRPVVQHWSSLFGGGGGRDVVMLVDCSASMNARSGGTSSMERAKTVSLAIAKQLSRDDRLTLVRVTAQPAEVFSRFSSDAETIEEQIRQLQSSPSRANFYAALNHVFGPQAQGRKKTQLYLLTDCQTGGWREVRDQPLDRLIPEDAKITVINVGSAEISSNRAVVGSAPRESRAIVGLPVVLRPRVANYSKTETLEVPISVVVGEKEVARTAVTLKPGESRVREVVYTPQEPGYLPCRFEIPTGSTSDRFPDDDTFLFTLQVVPQVKVLLVNGSPPGVDPYDNEGIYLRTALASTVAEQTASEAAELLPQEDFIKSLEIHEIPEAQLTTESLKDARVVILANCGTLNDQHFAWLRDYVAKGGGMLILPGDKVNPAQYNDRFFKVPGPQEQVITAATLGPPVGDADKAGTFERLGAIDFAHPVLSVFDDADASYLSTAFFFRRFPLTIDAEKGNSWPLAEFAGGGAALVESRFGDGIVQVAAFPANSKWTNLPLKPEFVPLALRLVSHLYHRPDLEAPSVVAADGSAEIGVSQEWFPAEGTVAGLSGGADKIEFKRSGTRLLAAYDRTTEKGFYTVTVFQGKGAEPKGKAMFAVNLSPDESRFDTADEDRFREWLPDVELAMVDATAEAEQLYGEVGGEAREVWRPLILLMFVIIIAEFMLATLGGGPTDNEEPVTVIDRIRSWAPNSWVGKMTGARHEVGVE
ncbi:MAG: VWA domain-containing protein [Pirellulales bacterium]